MSNANIKRLTIAAVLALASTATYAADLSVPIMPQPVEVSGWYLRGDLGFSNQNVGSLFNENYSRYNSVQNIYKNFDAAPFFGLGVGYSFNNWLRFDVTGEYRASANFHGYDIGVTSGPTFWPDLYTASKSEWTFLLNGYVDLGTWNCFTPFVGAGVGTSRNTISNFTDVNPIVNAIATSGPFNQWSFAWALYAGVGYQLTKNVTVELAYRYLDLGKAATGTMIGFDGTTDTAFEFNHLTSQDLKLGLRFNLDSFYEAPRPVYVPPPPLNSRG